MKKYLYYIPHIALAVIILMPAYGKITGAEMPVALFESLNLFNINPDLTRITLGIAQVLLVIGLFSKSYMRVSATLLAFNMIGVFVLLGGHTLAIVAFILALVIIVMGCIKGECSKGSCSMKKSCRSCTSKKCRGVCSSQTMMDSHEE